MENNLEDSRPIIKPIPLYIMLTHDEALLVTRARERGPEYVRALADSVRRLPPPAHAATLRLAKPYL